MEHALGFWGFGVLAGPQFGFAGTRTRYPVPPLCDHCLHMSDLGYQNRAQDQLHVSFSSLTEYTRALETAIRTPDPFYEKLGVREGDRWKQLNPNVLQIENEFYAAIRPKRIGKAGERPAKALNQYGVEYIEVRMFDLNPFVDIGISPEQSTFADVLLLMCPVP